MATPKQFAENIRRIASKIVANTDAGWRATALVVDQALVTGTPVDTGRARSNWRVSVGHPLEEAVEAFFPGRKGDTVSQNTSAAFEQGKQAVNRAGPSDNEIYISNNLDYIQALNDGSSAQAPAGFVEAAVAAGEAQVKKIKLLG